MRGALIGKCEPESNVAARRRASGRACHHCTVVPNIGAAAHRGAAKSPRWRGGAEGMRARWPGRRRREGRERSAENVYFDATPCMDRLAQPKRDARVQRLSGGVKQKAGSPRAVCDTAVRMRTKASREKSGSAPAVNSDGLFSRRMNRRGRRLSDAVDISTGGH